VHHGIPARRQTVNVVRQSMYQNSFYMNFKNFVQKYPASAYFITAFTLSWLGAFILVAPKLFHGQPIPKMDGILMFPVMLTGPLTASVVLTALTEGRTGLQNLISRMGKWKVSFKWYFISLIIPPCLIITALIFLKNFVSPVFAPNFFLLGLLFGIPAGFFEEIGWMGYAFPKMRLKNNFIKSGVLLGFLWGLWHLPVIDFLGAASPHGKYLLAFGISFIAAMAAIKVIISWIYSNTNSIILSQFMHAVSTSSLVIF
jgi:membrane protease YdiL (CAAX protease family)